MLSTRLKNHVIIESNYWWKQSCFYKEFILKGTSWLSEVNVQQSNSQFNGTLCLNHEKITTRDWTHIKEYMRIQKEM